jgi:hypothetical protein
MRQNGLIQPGPESQWKLELASGGQNKITSVRYGMAEFGQPRQTSQRIHVERMDETGHHKGDRPRAHSGTGEGVCRPGRGQ